MIDDQLHLAALFIITLVLCRVFRRTRGGLLMAITLAVLIAITKEVADYNFKPHWTLADSLKDMVFNGLGIFTGAIIGGQRWR